jgi:uncharacterized LabA/DUF88 family protein
MDTKSGTIYAFIDSQNLKLSVRNSVENRKGEIIYNGWDLDFKRFFIYLQDKYRVDKAYLFIGRVAGNEALYTYLENIGYTVIYKPTLVYTEGKKKVIKGNLDAELVLHTMIEYPNFSKAMIVAGDGDYYCLVEYLESQKKLLNVFIPNRYKFSSLLRKYFKYFVYVSDLRGKLERV